MIKKTAIIDYGMGNLYSVRNSFAALGMDTDTVGRGCDLGRYEKLILPGVGAFGDAMKELKKRGLIAPVRDFVASGRPLIGICLGMQLLLDESEESPGVEGLGIIPGRVRKFSGKLKVPHMGWNKIAKTVGRCRIFRGLKGNIYAYFCHSYYAVPKDKKVVIGETEYGVRFASMIEKGRVYGMQFHPEKSQDIGLTLLRNFIESC
ncbi:imidazole glycerol phosphate synthase subunit HisH [Candidatus Velamenicoccus archaeovorus]|uniref:Imidazole glycerol phosphate synthase subunit HisH n=1 Tax=Velamenicoccus archaeovorus TaxID=1930593 RepID=A0A410P4L3_VELA1|nr:imidazole glycerol phosphate synthase subunit HisH [Candidatus Velamenicoccus archaeovorus]QAT17145.1 imidazole glycerol phosphate synthase subunit HisH [Candidatus Velamenicoccus archaeovorus]